METTPAVSPPADVVPPPGPWQRVLYLAWPVLVQRLLEFAVNLSDRLLAGRFLPEVAYQSAQTTAGYLAWFVVSYNVLITVGSTALVARFTGAGDRAAAVRATHQALLLAALLGLLGTAAGLAGLDAFLHLLQLQEPTAGLAAGYLRPLVVLLPFQVVEAAAIACLIG